MNIALYHTTLPEPSRKVGGVEAVVHRLATALTEHTALNVTVLSLTPAPEGASYRHRHLFAGQRWLADRSWARWFVLPALLNRVDLAEYDVVHLHGDDWFWMRRGIPSVRTMHGSARDEARTATSLKRRLAQWTIYPLEHIAARRASQAWAISPPCADLYNTHACMPNGVDLGRFYPGAKASRPTVLFVGTWEGRKRGGWLAEQFCTRVLPRSPNATLVMVSDHVPEPYAAHPNIHVLHRPDDNTLAEWYRKSWAFAYPSIYEGFGLPYVEALASGTAIVASPNPGANYVLDDGRYGALVDDTSFADTLVQVLHDPDRRRTMARRGLQRAARFSWANVARQHADAYAALVHGASSTVSVSSPLPS
ncbi:MAG: glycosyltransferase family 4 protein [Longimonas sp.]|uniref:glycosyltransferase family 4 protein n=1 Tax=Longimonas sp. TaxID=2039626 RepID=UPI00336205B1